MKCPQCKTALEKVRFDIGYGVEVESLHCKNCGFNITEDSKIKKVNNSLREKVDGIRLKEAMLEIAHLKGASKKKTSDKEYEEIRKRAFEEISRKLK